MLNVLPTFAIQKCPKVGKQNPLIPMGMAYGYPILRIHIVSQTKTTSQPHINPSPVSNERRKKTVGKHNRVELPHAFPLKEGPLGSGSLLAEVQSESSKGESQCNLDFFRNFLEPGNTPWKLAFFALDKKMPFAPKGRIVLNNIFQFSIFRTFRRDLFVSGHFLVAFKHLFMAETG